VRLPVSLDDAAAKIEALRRTTERDPAYVPAQRERPAPRGWEPGIQYVGDERIITTLQVPGATPLPEAEWRPLLETMQGPLGDGWVLELVQANYDPVAWTRDVATDDDGKKTPAVTKPAWRYKFKARYDPQVGTRADLDQLADEIRLHKPSDREPVVSSSDDSFVVLLSDWQIGKADGDGLKGTVARVLKLIDDVETRITELRAIGRPLDTLTVLCGGDLVEGCDGFYAMQTFSVEADRRDQVKIARRLLRDALIRWSMLFNRVTVTGVGGNHGENRKDGKSFTTFADNDDVALIEQVGEILGASSAYDNVGFIIPTDQLAITIPVAGWTVGLHHGHFGRNGATAEQKIKRWYEGQAGGKLPIGDCDVLNTCHYHHWAVCDWGGCLWIQGSTIDGGSRWHADTTGSGSRQGTVTYTIDRKAFVRDLELV
jgi:hypothetical protein